MIRWLKRLFRPSWPREVACVDYARADEMLRANAGWRLAPEEDRNRVIGVVYLERACSDSNSPHTGND